jgi:hypothetical protein
VVIFNGAGDKPGCRRVFFQVLGFVFHGAKIIKHRDEIFGVWARQLIDYYSLTLKKIGVFRPYILLFDPKMVSMWNRRFFFFPAGSVVWLLPWITINNPLFDKKNNDIASKSKVNSTTMSIISTP